MSKDIFNQFNTDETLFSSHGMLCGFICAKPEITLQGWMYEVLPNADLKATDVAYKKLAQIFKETQAELSDETLNFRLLMADDNASLSEQSATLVEWCQGFLLGLGLTKIRITDDEVLELMKDFSAIVNLKTKMPESEENAQNLNEIIEFVRIGVLLIQETLQPLKQNYVSPDELVD